MSRIQKSFIQKAGIGFVSMAVIVAQFAYALPAHAESYLTLNSWSGNPGISLIASGGGWNAHDILNIFVGSTSGSPVTTATVATDGSFSTSVALPANAPQGPLSIIAVDQSNNQQSSNSYYVVPLQPTIVVAATSHMPYSSVSISGAGFAANESVTLSLAGATSHITADAQGAFTNGTITVPAVAPGLYTIRATGNLSGAASTDYLNYFWIDGFYPSISPSTYYVMPGGSLNFTGSGFAAGETITVTSGTNATPVSSFTADTSGSFMNAGAFTVPVSLHGGTGTFTLTGGTSHAAASVDVTIGSFYAFASPTTYWTLPGGTTAFNGGGFAANEIVSIYKGAETTPVTTITTDSSGSFISAGTLMLPIDAANSTVTYRLVGNLSNAQTSASITVGSYYPSISPSAYYVNGNTTIGISGTGYAPNETITLAVNGIAATTTVTTNISGSFMGTVDIPFTTKKASTITAVGSLSKGLATVDVTMATYYPSVVPSAYYIFPGQALSFTGSGFVPNETVTLSYASGENQVASSTTITADSFGTFTTSAIQVPYSASGSLVTTVSGNLSNNPITSTITIGALSAYLNSDAYSAKPGDTIHVTGTGFAAGEHVNVTAGTVSSVTTAHANGSTDPVSIVVPFNAGTSLHVVFTGAETHVSSSLDVSLAAFYPSITSDNYYAAPGSTIHISATGFAPNEGLTVTAGTLTASSTTDSFGAATVPVTIAYGTGDVTISVVGVKSGATGSITIARAPVNSTLAPSTYYTAPGSSITFTGTGFAPNESIAVMLNTGSIASTTSDGTGAVSYTTTIPLSTSGIAHYVFTGSVEQTAMPIDITLASFYGGISLSNYYAQAGSALTITGTGFGPNESVAITSGSKTIASTTVDSTGAFTYATTVPFAPAGQIDITATGKETGTTATSNMTIAPVYTSLELSSYAGAPGSNVTFIGSGYLPNETISVSTDRGSASTTASALTYTFQTDSSGSFNNSGFSIPSDMTEGNLMFTVSSNHSFDSKTITYYVTGQ